MNRHKICSTNIEMSSDAIWKGVGRIPIISIGGRMHTVNVQLLLPWN